MPTIAITTNTIITKTITIKTNFIVDVRCEKCFLKTYQRLFQKFKASSKSEELFYAFFQEILREQSALSNPEIQKLLQNKFCELIRIVDPFAEEKKNSNRIALSLYDEWKPKVFASENPFDVALRLAIAGNIMDYGANNSFDIHKTIERVLTTSFAIDHSKALQTKIKQAKKILYLGDNAGEIVFDRLFIETFMHNNITFAVKAAPILNDVTLDDAKQVEIDLVADVISNGYDAPSTILNKCSNEFINIYNSADLIISKGQGNFEGLMHQNDPRIFFLMMIKCDVIAEMLNVEKGSFVVYNQNIQ
ncbi:MAG: damage-control phosphatase ARMT1 family protein [Bacteroidales bacterium]